jgi:Holliday junction DNA helicase RuvA
VIGYLRGIVRDSDSPGAVLIDVCGVGYKVVTTPASAHVWQGASGEVEVHVHTHVREDAIVLFGFAEQGERKAFEVLLSAHGVGPSLALGVLATLSPSALAEAVEREDPDFLTVVPGVGKKTAQRLILDLKGKFDPPVGEASTRILPQQGSVTSEVRSALEGLGFSAQEAVQAVDELDETLSLEAALKIGLQRLASR